MPTLKSLYIYPIKSTKAISLNSTTVDRLGLQWDRRWMLVDDEGKYMTQRHFPMMSQLRVELKRNKAELHIPNKSPLSIQPEPNQHRMTVKIWDDQVDAMHVSEDIDAAVSEFLQTSCRLVFFDDDAERSVDQNYAKPDDTTAFSDGFPLLVISQGSLDALNERMDEPVSMLRFRPNLVIDGVSPFAEDEYNRMQIGDVIFRIVKPCARCVMVNVNPQTAEKSAIVLRTLVSFRQMDGKVYFGQNVIPDCSGNITIGDTVKLWNE